MGIDEEFSYKRLYELLSPDRLEKAKVYLVPDCSYNPKVFIA